MFGDITDSFILFVSGIEVNLGNTLGGTVVCAGIHMSDIPSFPYDILWRERSLRSVANLTRKDGEEFLALAPKAGVKTSVEPLPLNRANEALARLREGRLRGAAVLTML